MKFHDKIFQFRKKAGLTQAELAETLNVSRQSISKWEMGIATPDIENILALSKLFGVSVDYLINETMNSELDSPVAKATAAFFKINYQFILVRVLIACGLVAVVSIIGAVTHSLIAMVGILSILGILLLLYYVVRLLILYFSTNKR